VHVVRQAPVPQTYGVQLADVAARQVPVPLHVRAGVTVEPVHVAATQVVPAAYRWQPPPPSHVPSAPHVATPASVHWFSGSWPLGTFTQVPAEPAIAHERQVPVHGGPVQQTPWEQLFELHSALPAHVVPTDFRPQLPALQTLGDAQSALVVQVVRQAPVPHAKGAQLEEVTVWQVPVPLHVRAGVTVEPVHVAAAHCAPAPYRRHAPLPLHMPSVLQLATPRSAHWFSGSAPAATFVHVPRVPASAHDLHIAVHTDAQQMPCAQTLFAQSPSAVQVAPLGRLVHTPTEQMLGARQSPSMVHVVRHAPVPQR
jgi:hypothetical protein